LREKHLGGVAEESSQEQSRTEGHTAGAGGLQSQFRGGIEALNQTQPKLNRELRETIQKMVPKGGDGSRSKKGVTDKE
jgi:hypothetical protein